MFKWNEIYWKIGVSLTITFLDRENSTLVRVIVIATKFPFFQASLDPGEATGWDVGDLFTLPVAFQPKSFYPPAPTLRLSSPLPTPRLSSDPNSLPNRLSSPLPTRCLSRLHVFMNSGASQPTQVFHTSKTSPENPEEWAAKRKEDSEKETEGSL